MGYLDVKVNAMTDDYGGPERRNGEHCPNHEVNTKDISSIKGWIRGIVVVGAVLAFFGSRYMDSIEEQLRMISETTQETNVTVNTLATNFAVTRTEVEQLKKDMEILKERVAVNTIKLYGGKQ